jgi:hypothetical protein
VLCNEEGRQQSRQRPRKGDLNTSRNITKIEREKEKRKAQTLLENDEGMNAFRSVNLLWHMVQE